MHRDMSKNVIRLEGDACYEITVKSASLPYKAGSKMPEGSTYTRYSYNGVIFNVNDDFNFKEPLLGQDLASVKLIERTWERTVNENGVEVKKEEKGYDFDSFVKESDSFARDLRRAKHTAVISTIKRVAEAEKIDAEGMKALLSASI